MLIQFHLRRQLHTYTHTHTASDIRIKTWIEALHQITYDKKTRSEICQRAGDERKRLERALPVCFPMNRFLVSISHRSTFSYSLSGAPQLDWDHFVESRASAAWRRAFHARRSKSSSSSSDGEFSFVQISRYSRRSVTRATKPGRGESIARNRPAQGTKSSPVGFAKRKERDEVARRDEEIKRKKKQKATAASSNNARPGRVGE